MTFGAGLELQMSISELMPRPERARRLEVFTGAGRRRTIQGFEAMLWLRKGFGFAGLLDGVRAKPASRSLFRSPAS